MKIKTCSAQIKAAGTHEGTEDGQFNALVATYDLDSVGDKILPGAFAGTLADWTKSGNPIPVYWSHRMDDPTMNIGTVLDAKETKQGLEVKAQLDLDNPVAAQVYRLLKGRRVTQFSFAYDVEDGALVDQKGTHPFYELRKLKLYEVGPTPIGANQSTELIDVKSAQGNVTVEVHNGSPGEVAVIGKAVRRALTGTRVTKAPTVVVEPPEVDADPDDDPNAMAAAVDAILDEAVELLSGTDLSTLPPEVQQAIALVNGAEAIMDDLLEALGIPDADDLLDADEPKNNTRFRAKVGRRNSADDAKHLQVIHDAAMQLGATCRTDGGNDGTDSPSGGDGISSDTSGDSGKATPNTPATTEEPDGAKADQPAWNGTASIRLRTELDLLAAEFL